MMQDLQSHEPSGDTGRRVTETAKEQGREIKEAVKQEASSFADKARHQADEKKEQGAATIGDFAEAIRRAGDELRDRDQSMGAQLAQQAADGLAGLSRSLSNKSPEEMLRSAREFGRDNPGAFFAASVLAGVALGRVAGASSNPRPSADRSDLNAIEPSRDRGDVFATGDGATASGGSGDGEFNVVTARHDPPSGQGPSAIPTGSPGRTNQDTGGDRG